MMNKDYYKTLNATLGEAPDRLYSLRKYYPFFEMLKLNITSQKYENIDMGEVSICLLSFLFYEGKLKSKNITFENISDFLKMLLLELYEEDLNEVDISEFTEYVLNKMQPNDGKGFELSFRTLGDKSKNMLYIKYLTMGTNERSGEKYFSISAEAIDFFLGTKEFGEESKITISLLLLRKLIENNEYDSALLSLVNVNAEVLKQIAKVDDIENALQYGGKSGYKIFNGYIELANKRQKEEQKLFSETIEEIRILREDYLSKVSKSELGEKEKNAFECLDKMDRELIKTVELHYELLSKIVILIKRSDEIHKNKRRNLLKPNFDFNRFLDRAVEHNDASVLESAIFAFLPINVVKSFNVDRIEDIVTNQTNNKEDDLYTEGDLLDEDFIPDRFDKEIKERILNNYSKLSFMLYKVIQKHGPVTISKLIEISKEHSFTENLINPDFVGFIVDIKSYNQEKIIKDIKKGKSDEKSTLESALEILSKSINKQVCFSAETVVDNISNRYVEIMEGFEITNVLLDISKGRG